MASFRLSAGFSGTQEAAGLTEEANDQARNCLDMERNNAGLEGGRKVVC